MTTDTIADMLTRIRNANLAKHQIVQIPSTKVTRSIANVLLAEGFIESFEELKNGLRSSLLLSLREERIALCDQSRSSATSLMSWDGGMMGGGGLTDDDVYAAMAAATGVCECRA